MDLTKLLRILLYLVICIIISACDYSKEKVLKNMEEIRSIPISISYDDMKCLTPDSIAEKKPWIKAKLKLIHYIDSLQCSTCYLQKVAMHDELFRIERESNYEFYNIFIVDPRSNNTSIAKLTAQYSNKELPTTIFYDSAHVFFDANPQIPKEIMYHTFLLDENNNVIFVGNPLLNPNVKEKMLHIIEDRVHKRK